MILTCPSCDARYKLDTAALRPEGQTVRCYKCKHTWTQKPSEAEEEGAPEGMAPEDMGEGAGEDIGEDIGGEDIGEDVGEDIGGEDIGEDVGEDVGEDIGGEDIGEDIGEDMGEDVGEDVGEDIGEDIGEDEEPIDLEDFEPRPVDRETGKPIETKPPSKIGKIINWLLFLFIFGGTISSAIIYRDTVRDIWPVSNRLYILIGLGVEAPGTGLELRNVSSKRGKTDGIPSLTINGEISNISRKVREVPLFRGELTDSAGEPLHNWTFTIRQKNLLPGESVPFTTVVSDLPKGAAGLNITFIAHEPAPEAMPPGDTPPGDTPPEAMPPGDTPPGDTPEDTPEDDGAMEEEAPLDTEEEMEEEAVEEMTDEVMEEKAAEEMMEEGMEEEMMEEEAAEEPMDETMAEDEMMEESPEEAPAE